MFNNYKLTYLLPVSHQIFEMKNLKSEIDIIINLAGQKNLFDLKIKSDSESDLSGTISSRRKEQIGIVKINELRAEAKNGGV